MGIVSITSKSYTLKYRKHDAVSFSIYIVYADGDYGPAVTYSGQAKIFVYSMFNESRKIHILIQCCSQTDRYHLYRCHSYYQLYSMSHLREAIYRPVSLQGQNDHITGKFRGIAHNTCNLKYCKPNVIPIFNHNLSGYVTHLFIKIFGLDNETMKHVTYRTPSRSRMG